MHPALPDRPLGEPGEHPHDAGHARTGETTWMSADEVGEFQQGSPVSRWALARYLVGRAIAESVGNSLLILAVVMLGLGALCQWALDSTFLAVVVAVIAGIVLLVRAGLRAIVRRLTSLDHFPQVQARLRALVADTRGDVRRELRRIGLPSHVWTMPLLAVRLAGKRRRETLDRLRRFEVDRTVPKARLDELHLLLRSAVGGG